MIPLHLSSQPSTSDIPHGTVVSRLPRARGTISAGTVHYIYPVPVMGTIPVRLRMQTEQQQQQQLKNGNLMALGSHIGELSEQVARIAAVRNQRIASATIAVPRPRPRSTPLRATLFDLLNHHHQATNGSLVAEEQQRTPSQFNPTAFESPSLNSRRESQRRGSFGNVSDHHGALVVYDPQIHSLVPASFIPPPPPPPMHGWYPHPPPMPSNGLPMYVCAGPPPPPQTMAIPPDPLIIRKAIKEATKLEKKKLKASKMPSPCCVFCCGGIAQLMWTIIAIVLMGFIAALVLALFVV